MKVQFPVLKSSGSDGTLGERLECYKKLTRNPGDRAGQEGVGAAIWTTGAFPTCFVSCESHPLVNS